MSLFVSGAKVQSGPCVSLPPGRESGLCHMSPGLSSLQEQNSGDPLSVHPPFLSQSSPPSSILPSIHVSNPPSSSKSLIFSPSFFPSLRTILPSTTLSKLVPFPSLPQSFLLPSLNLSPFPPSIYPPNPPSFFFFYLFLLLFSFASIPSEVGLSKTLPPTCCPALSLIGIVSSIL